MDWDVPRRAGVIDGCEFGIVRRSFGTPRTWEEVISAAIEKVVGLTIP